MSSAVAKVARPELRGFLQRYIKKHLAIGMILTLTVGYTLKKTVADRRKRNFAEFYKNYDAEAEFKRMKDLGLFQSG